RVGELRDHVGAHERGHFEPAQARRREHVDQPHLGLGRDHLGLVLEAVARPNLADLHLGRQPAHAVFTTPTSMTRRSWVPTPIVRSPSFTSTSKRSLRPSTTSRKRAWAVQLAPSAAAATCLTQTSKPTVALPSGRCS